MVIDTIQELEDLEKLDKSKEYKISNGLLVYTDKTWLLCMGTKRDGRGWAGASYNVRIYNYGWWIQDLHSSAILPIEIEIPEQELIW